MPDTNNFVAGDYILEDVVIVGQNLPQIAVKNLMLELNIYESINSPHLTGDLTIRDTMNHRSNMSMTGQEEIEFVLSTNDESEEIDFKTLRGRIYRISNIVSTTATEQVYTLHFVTKDAMRNTQTRVKSAYKGASNQIVSNILTNVLKSEKPFFAETSSHFMHVVGNLRYPFEFIRMCARRSVSTDHADKSYLFFENHRGYNFASRSKLIFDAPFAKRPVHESFYTSYQKPKVDTPEEMRTMLSYQIVSQQDVLRDNVNGLLNNTHYNFNRTGKSLEKKISSYETYANDRDLDGFPLYTETPEKNSDRLFDFPDSQITLGSFDPFLHTQSTSDNTSYKNTNPNQPDSMRETLSSNIKVKIELHGNSNLAAGDIIQLDIPNHEPIINSQDTDVHDVFLSGSYIIENIVHKVDPLAYKCVCDCVRRSVSTKYEDNTQSIDDNMKNFVKPEGPQLGLR